jgi:hypothetical protein
VLEQRIGRIYRLGQKDPIDVINLVTEYGIEARIAGLVDSKHALFSGLFDGTTDAVRFDGPSSFIGDIERLVEPIEVPDLETSDDASESSDDALEAEPDGSAIAADAIAPERAAPEAAAAATAPAAPEAVVPEAPDWAAPGIEPSAPSIEAARLDVASLFTRISVSRTADGGLRIEAPPSAAAELSQLLVGLAGLLQAAGAAQSDASAQLEASGQAAIK